MERFFAPCPRGLEGALASELAELGAAEITRTDGGVGFAGVVAEPAGEVTTVDVDADESTANVSAAFSVFTAHAVAANRNAMERRIEGIEVMVRLRLR